MSEIVADDGLDFSRIRDGDRLIFAEMDFARMEPIDFNRLLPAVEKAAARAGFMITWSHSPVNRCWYADIRRPGFVAECEVVAMCAFC